MITGEIQALAEPIPEGGTHTITEASTGNVYTLWSDTQYTGIDLSQYEGQNVTVYGIFQTLGNPLSSFSDPTEVPIAVTSVESLEPLPVAPPANELPDTGGFSPAVLVLVALLLLGGGGLLAYGLARQR